MRYSEWQVARTDRVVRALFLVAHQLLHAPCFAATNGERDDEQHREGHEQHQHEAHEQAERGDVALQRGVSGS